MITADAVYKPEVWIYSHAFNLAKRYKVNPLKLVNLWELMGCPSFIKFEQWLKVYTR